MQALGAGLLKKRPILEIVPQEALMPVCYGIPRTKCYHPSHNPNNLGKCTTKCFFCNKPCCKLHSAPTCNACYTRLQNVINAHNIVEIEEID